MSLIILKGDLERARLIAGHSQVSLASEVGVTSQHINRIEKGVCRPSAKTAKKIADAVGTNWHELFFIEPPHKSRSLQ